MKKFSDDLVRVLEYLCDMYERYLLRNQNSKLEVLIQDKVISFYLSNDSEDIDEFIIGFEDAGYKLYTYICVRIMIMLLGNVIIHRNENELYNNLHKPYLKLIVNDEYVLDVMTKIISMQDKLVISSKMEIVQDMKDVIPWQIYPKKFMRTLKKRVILSEKLLKR